MPTLFGRHLICGHAVFILFSLRVTSAWAAIPAPSDTENYMRMIWGLLIVLGIIFVLYGLTKKRFSLLGTSSKHEIRVLEMKPLMGKKGLCLVQVRGQEYLLGIGGDTVTHIATLSGKRDQSFAETLAQSGETSKS
jgi:flagellar protein FliO/FliZ